LRNRFDTASATWRSNTGPKNGPAGTLMMAMPVESKEEHTVVLGVTLPGC
jgi:hypothetical protein